MTGRELSQSSSEATTELWRKSSYSPDNGNGQSCVEIARLTPKFGIRDAKLGDASPVFTLVKADFATFLRQTKS